VRGGKRDTKGSLVVKGRQTQCSGGLRGRKNNGKREGREGDEKNREVGVVKEEEENELGTKRGNTRMPGTLSARYVGTNSPTSVKASVLNYRDIYGNRGRR